LGANFQWGIIDYPKLQLKRELLFGISDVLGNKTHILRLSISSPDNYFCLVYIGGLGGLFLGTPTTGTDFESISSNFCLNFCRLLVARFYRIDILLHMAHVEKYLQVLTKVNYD
jgi:hypothetical protein